MGYLYYVYQTNFDKFEKDKPEHLCNVTDAKTLQSDENNRMNICALVHWYYLADE